MSSRRVLEKKKKMAKKETGGNEEKMEKKMIKRQGMVDSVKKSLAYFSDNFSP